jgi:DNA-binding LacI/PurR family transcriptional regulator
VRKAADRLGYVRNYHAGSLRSGRAHAVGFAFEFGIGRAAPADLKQSMLGNDYWSRIIGGVAFEARNAGYQLNLVGPTPEDGGLDLAFRHLRERRIDGLVVPAQVRKELWRPLLNQSDSPVVLVGHREATVVPVVDYDDAGAIEKAVAHLAGLGHQHVLWYGPPSEPDADTADRRAKAFAYAALNAGLHGSVERFTRDELYPDPPRTIEYAHAGMRQMLREARQFTAVVCYNDHTALGVYRAAYEHGLSIPRDLSVVGFDDFVADHAWPPMTTVSHQCSAMGRRAAQLLLEMVENPDRRHALCGHYEQVKPELVLRQSTGPPAA